MMFRRTGKKGNYAYTVARVKAKKSLLLGEEDYNKMLMMTVPEISRYISETGYGKEMTDMASNHEGLELLEYATYSSMAKVFSSILASSEGELKDMVSAYLTKWDIWNLKVILRGKSYGLDAVGMREDLVPAGSLNAESLEKLMALDTDDDIIANFSVMSKMSFPPEVLADYKSNDNLGILEDYLEKFHYERLISSINAASRASSLFLMYVKEEVDIKNFETIIKLKSEGIFGEPVMKYLIPGGRRLDNRLLTLFANAESMESVSAEASQLEFYDYIKDDLEVNNVRGVVSNMVKFEMKKAKKFSHQYPLSVVPVIDYMLSKENEVRNIRVIARGTESGLDREVIRGLLVV